MKVFVLQENNPKNNSSRIVGASNEVRDLAGLRKELYPSYREYKGTGLLYNKDSLEKGIGLSKLKNVCLIEFDLGNFQETSVAVPVTDEVLEEATIALNMIFGE